MVSLSASNNIQMFPIGHVKRESVSEDDKDRSYVVRIVIDEELTPALEGIEEWSHVYIIFYMHLQSVQRADWAVEGLLALRTPKHPNSIGLTLVELLKREDNVLWVRGLDALDESPVLDIKPYPDWNKGRWQIVKEFRAPVWLRELNKDQYQ